MRKIFDVYIWERGRIMLDGGIVFFLKKEDLLINLN